VNKFALWFEKEEVKKAKPMVVSISAAAPQLFLAKTDIESILFVAM